MGFNEFGQSLAGMIAFILVFLAVFGGFQNQTILEPYYPTGVNTIGDINNQQNSITVSNSATPFATQTGTNPSQDNNPWQNSIIDDFNKALAFFGRMIGGLFDAITYIGIPKEIIYLFIVPLSVFAGIFTIYFVVSVAVGIWRGG